MKEITESDKCNHAKKMLLNGIAEVIAYSSWSDEFKLKRINEIVDRFIKSNGYIDISNLTIEQVDDIGFRLWSDESNMRLIPLWLFPFIDKSIRLKIENLDGTREIIFPDEMDNDNRFGFLAYGLWFK